MGKYERVVWRDGQDTDTDADIDAVRPYAPAAPGPRKQVVNGDDSGLRFETLGHGQAEPDMMPLAIRVTDSKGRSCLYVPAAASEADDGEYVELDPDDTWLGG